MFLKFLELPVIVSAKTRSGNQFEGSRSNPNLSEFGVRYYIPGYFIPGTGTWYRNQTQLRQWSGLENGKEQAADLTSFLTLGYSVPYAC